MNILKAEIKNMGFSIRKLRDKETNTNIYWLHGIVSLKHFIDIEGKSEIETIGKLAETISILKEEIKRKR